MPHALLDRDVIDTDAEQYFRSVGTIFVEFSDLTQDSGNVSYGLQVGAVVAKACDPDRSCRFDSMAAFCRAWRAARTA